MKGYGVDVYDSLPFGGGTMLIGVPRSASRARRSRWTSASSSGSG